MHIILGCVHAVALSCKKKIRRFSCSQTGDKTWFWNLCNMSVWICVLVRNTLVWIWVHVRNTGLIILVTHWTSNTKCHLIPLHGLTWDFRKTSTCYCGSWHFCWDEASCIDRQKKRANVAHIPMCCAGQTNSFLGHVPSPAPSSSFSFSCVFCLFSGWLEFHLLLITSSHIWKLLRCLLHAHQETFILTLRRLMSYIYGAPILDVSRSHTTTQHSR